MDADTVDAWRALLDAHATVVARVERALADGGLPPLQWYDALWPLHRAPKRRLRMNELATQVTLSRTGLTRLVDRLEAAGMLRREPVPNDRRGAYAVITADGSALLRKMWPVYRSVLGESFAPRNARSLARDLRRAVHSADG